MISLPVMPSDSNRPQRRLPPWLKRPLPLGGEMAVTRQVVSSSRVATVCQEAHCPNLMECWSHKTATFMILGDKCTRRCRYCAVNTARPDPPEPDEPKRLADAVAELGLRHVVITAVARDDLDDEGAGQFAACIRAVRAQTPQATIEVLPADMHARRDCIETICNAGPDVFNHNLETVERLTPIVRPQAKYRRSLEVLRLVKELRPNMPTKSGLMVGLGETLEELHQALADLREVGCDVVTLGQYLQPTPKHAPIARFYTPEEFDALAETCRELGFLGVASGPFVRSSYNAAEVYDRVRGSA
ncbi:MAG TPA: lipoyl synthase [Phycisphaerae bacterium]|jgi:lipoic acid synthetase|nr:lipoyl synthase [Phycisphaerae bacterium]HOL25624.1 lipoyl synthase [Phycisphaerae bacterium]HPP22739.1 lipoyl synthase [Phycisphaerae bacterium]HPU31842.1 lipoyl synthase [Phycisphaerae bacterium]HQA46103.1 lipoyl synthase [Phycisphaerae bacterium]